jgi:exopolysaccharide biosynthesis polyprenyl glycosylphosphotransferase
LDRFTGGGLSVAIPEPLELAISTPRALRSRPPLSSLLPAVDAFALVLAWAASTFDPLALGLAALTFVVLNGDTSRRFRLQPRLGDDAGWLLSRVAIAVLVTTAVVWVGGLWWWEATPLLARLGLFALVVSAAVLVGRAVAYGLMRTAKARGLVWERALIVGDGELAGNIAQTLAEHPEFGLRPFGYVGRPSVDLEPLPLIGDVQDLDRVIREHEARRAIIAFGEMPDQELVTILRANEGTAAEIHVVPRFFELSGIPQGCAMDDLFGIPLLHLRRPALRPGGRFQKRVFDLVVSTLLLILTLPMFLILALLVRLSSPGPVLFRQKRVGLNGRVFEIVKFRTMYENEDSDTAWFDPADERARVTPVGHFLRTTSLDELPQLLNVLKGDMSLVGPRPERPHYTGRFAASVRRYDDRHRVVGGITGWAQIHGRNRGLDSVPQRARLDNYYIENWSIWRDLVIIARTIGVLFRGR